jgi:hypothetical protein
VSARSIPQQQSPDWVRLIVFILCLVAIPALCFDLRDGARLLIEWRQPGPHILYMPGDPSQTFYSRVVGIEVVFYSFLARWHRVLVLACGILTAAIIFRQRRNLLLILQGLLAFSLLVVADALLALHYKLGW